MLEVSGILTVAASLALKQQTRAMRPDYRWIMIIGAFMMAIGMVMANDTPIVM